MRLVVRMKFSQLAFIVTDDCNYNCFYCPQKKENIYMKQSTLEKAVEFFYPFLDEEAYIVFYGGEPLLAFDNIKYTVSLLREKSRQEEKKIKYSITTNGSLVTKEVLHFLNENGFNMVLSFDGLAQDMRNPGSFTPTRDLIGHIQNKSYPNIEFSTHSVFSPESVHKLSASLQYIIECGVTELTYALTWDIPWDDTVLQVFEKELTYLRDFLVSYFKVKGMIPVTNFRQEEPLKKSHQVYACAAGIKHMAITPEENLWGCYLFHDYFKNREENPDFYTYYFGKLDTFLEHHETVYLCSILNYTILRQEFFFTENQNCFLCPSVDNCNVCPILAAYATSFIGKIPNWICRINRIERIEKKQFLETSGKVLPLCEI
jgi:sulfatase maturation enzyme AslB (radical SAM superfamily)